MIRPVLVIVGLGFVALLSAAVHSLLAAPPSSCSSKRHKPAVVLIKVGGSSITNKAVQETLNEPALEWFAKTIHEACCSSQHQEQQQQSFVIVHGAGSFGHHTAKSYGLRGQTEPPPPRIESNCSSSSSSSSHSPFEGDATTTTTTNIAHNKEG